jgi:hypothetical protein
MSEIEDSALERRLQRNTYLVIAVAQAVSLLGSGRRMALGVLLGGALSLFNKRWLRGSIRAMLGQANSMGTGKVPPLTVWKFILRYYIIALIIGIAIWTGWFHVLGIGVGFAALVGGMMIEAGSQMILALRPGENTSKE